jgi:hypothetical protein
MPQRLVPTAAALVLALGACSEKKKAPAAGERAATNEMRGSAPEVAPEPRVAPPPKPLPPLAAEIPTGVAAEVTWVTSMGGTKVDNARRITAGADGSLYVAGDFELEGTFGAAGVRTTAGKSDAFVAQLDGSGAVKWVTTIGGANEERGDAVAVDDKGNVALAGLFSDKLTAGTLTAEAAGSDDLFVVGLDAKGEVNWLWNAGALASDAATAVAPAGDGGWIVAISFGQAFEMGKAWMKSRGGDDAALVKLSSGGDLEWFTQIGGEYGEEITHVDVDPAGNIYVLGLFRGTLAVGGAAMTSAGDTDLFVARFDPVGNHVWSKRIGNAFAERPGGLTVDPAGHVAITGSFDKDVDFLGTPVLSRGESDAFVARMSSDGDLLWVKTYGAERADVGLGIDADRAGNLIVAGGFETTIDLGGGTYKTKGYMDGWVAKFAPDGAHQWSRRFGGKDIDVGLATATTADGTPFLAGSYRFQLDLQPDGPTAVQSEGQKLAKPDMFVARLVP